MATTIRNQKLFCGNCGGEQVIPYPIAIPMMTAMMEAFDKMHKKCEKTWKQPEVDQSKSVSEKANFWLLYGEHGSSSKTMFQTLSGRPMGFDQASHPYDADDFRRCYMLLKTVPEWRADIHKMKEVSPAWNNLADNWDKLTDMLEEMMDGKKSNGLSKLIQTLINEK